jgi:hypothetical protein
MTFAASLLDIADRLARLSPSHRDPHRFHEEKSELVAELRRLAGGRISFSSGANDNRASSAGASQEPGVKSLLFRKKATRLATMRQGERTALEHSEKLPKVSQVDAAPT